MRPRDQTPDPTMDLLPRSGGPTQPHGLTATNRGAFFAPPELGAEVRFKRSPSHAPELGFVRSRQFGTGHIGVMDWNGKELQILHGQYEVIADAKN